MTTSGRFYVDVEQCARDGEGLFVTPLPPPPPRELAPESCRPPALPPSPAPHVVSPDAVRWLGPGEWFDVDWLSADLPVVEAVSRVGHRR